MSTRSKAMRNKRRGEQRLRNWAGREGQLLFPSGMRSTRGQSKAQALAKRVLKNHNCSAIPTCRRRRARDAPDSAEQASTLLFSFLVSSVIKSLPMELRQTHAWATARPPLDHLERLGAVVLPADGV